MIEIRGMSDKQMALADIMWAISSKEGVDEFMATLPQVERRECETVRQMIMLACFDQCDDTQEANQAIDEILKR